MFWRVKSSLDDFEEGWQLACWEWMFEHLGAVEFCRSLETALPNPDHFPRSGKSGLEHAWHVFFQVAEKFQVNVSNFDLRLQEEGVDPVVGKMAVVQNAPVEPLGTYSVDDDKHVITLAPGNLQDLEGLISTLAHELCHPIMFNIPVDRPGGDELEEHMTDLAVAFHGFGVFGANTSFRFGQFSDQTTGMQGWASSGAGYLTQAEWGFALAVRTLITEEDERLVARYLSPGAVAHYKKNLKYLRKHPELLKGF